MDIRDATTDDLPTVRSLAREAWLKAYADVVPDSVVEDAVSEWYAEETMNRIIGDVEQVCLVAVDAEEIVGFAHGATDRSEGDVLRLYVHPDRWHEGIGSALLEATERELRDRGAETVQAMVLADNEMGNAFYEAQGFEKTGEAETKLGETTRKEHVYAKAH